MFRNKQYFPASHKKALNDTNRVNINLSMGRREKRSLSKTKSNGMFDFCSSDRNRSARNTNLKPFYSTAKNQANLTCFQNFIPPSPVKLVTPKKKSSSNFNKSQQNINSSEKEEYQMEMYEEQNVSASWSVKKKVEYSAMKRYVQTFKKNRNWKEENEKNKCLKQIRKEQILSRLERIRNSQNLSPSNNFKTSHQQILSQTQSKAYQLTQQPKYQQKFQDKFQYKSEQKYQSKYQPKHQPKHQPKYEPKNQPIEEPKFEQKSSNKKPQSKQEYLNQQSSKKEEYKAKQFQVQDKIEPAVLMNEKKNSENLQEKLKIQREIEQKERIMKEKQQQLKKLKQLAQQKKKEQQKIQIKNGEKIKNFKEEEKEKENQKKEVSVEEKGKAQLKAQKIDAKEQKSSDFWSNIVEEKNIGENEKNQTNLVEQTEAKKKNKIKEVKNIKIQSEKKYQGDEIDNFIKFGSTKKTDEKVVQSKTSEKEVFSSSSQEVNEQVIDEINAYVYFIDCVGDYSKSSKQFYEKIIRNSNIQFKVVSYFMTQQFYFLRKKTIQILKQKKSPYYSISKAELKKNSAEIDGIIEQLEDQNEKCKAMIKKNYNYAKESLPQKERVFSIDHKVSHHLKCLNLLSGEFKDIYKRYKQALKNGENDSLWARRLCYIIEIYLLLKTLNGEETKEFEELDEIKNYQNHLDKYKHLII